MSIVPPRRSLKPGFDDRIAKVSLPRAGHPAYIQGTAVGRAYGLRVTEIKLVVRSQHDRFLPGAHAITWWGRMLCRPAIEVKPDQAVYAGSRYDVTCPMCKRGVARDAQHVTMVGRSVLVVPELIGGRYLEPDGTEHERHRLFLPDAEPLSPLPPPESEVVWVPPKKTPWYYIKSVGETFGTVALLIAMLAWPMTWTGPVIAVVGFLTGNTALGFLGIGAFVTGWVSLTVMTHSLAWWRRL